jgi:hypothetical protein
VNKVAEGDKKLLTDLLRYLVSPVTEGLGFSRFLLVSAVAVSVANRAAIRQIREPGRSTGCPATGVCFGREGILTDAYLMQFSAQITKTQQALGTMPMIESRSV